jgi:uncharacterized protein with PIN domain
MLDCAERPQIRTVSISEHEFDFAAQAYAAFGKPQHEAGLNVGSRFAHTGARTNRVALLFKEPTSAGRDIRVAW